jgi:phosphatidylglycerophosphate synthase
VPVGVQRLEEDDGIPGAVGELDDARGCGETQLPEGADEDGRQLDPERKQAELVGHLRLLAIQTLRVRPARQIERGALVHGAELLGRDTREEVGIVTLRLREPHVVARARRLKPNLLEEGQRKERKGGAPRYHRIGSEPLDELGRLHRREYGTLRSSVVRAADGLTVGRAVAALPVAALILIGRDRTAGLLVALAGISDLLDGWLARRMGASSLGRQLDPLADKLLTDTALFALAVRGRVAWRLVAPLAVRDVLVTSLRLADGSLTPSWPARIKTGALYGSLTLILRGQDGGAMVRAGQAGVAAALVLALLSALGYVRRR